MSECKYFRPFMPELKRICKEFYTLDGCGAGGPLHILLDDCNFRDEDLDFCDRYIPDYILDRYNLDITKNIDEWPVSKGIEDINKIFQIYRYSIFIVKSFRLMDRYERCVFMEYFSGWNYECENNSNCDICSRLQLLDDLNITDDQCKKDIEIKFEDNIKEGE